MLTVESDMDIEELLTHLDRAPDGSFPKELVAEIIARREEVTPRLLRILEDIDRDPEPWLANADGMLHIWAFYLLALFRETRAYPLLVRIFSRPGEFAFELAGDVLTQDLSRILSSVCGGEFSGMKTLIENEQANGYVRGAAMDGMVSTVTSGQKTRDEVMAYFLQLFQRLERKPGTHWDGLASACADLWPQEAVEELDRAFGDGLIDSWSIDWQDIERALALGRQGAMQQARYREPLITDLARDMGWMQYFQRPTLDHDGEEDRDEDLPKPVLNDWATEPIRRTSPKVGRNEPCPCGSGKKFKKCCGAN